MLLAIDIGNTNIVFGIHEKDEWCARWRIRTVRDKMPDEYAVLLKEFIREDAIRIDTIDSVVLTSVVPPLTAGFVELCQRYLWTEPIIIGPGVRTGIDIRTENPSEVGADLVANAAAAYDLFSQDCIVVDFGTATTFSAVASPGVFLGVAIAPGLRTAAEALSTRAAQLPRIDLKVPQSAIGRNTTQSMQAGLMLGFVHLTEGLIRRLRNEMDTDARVVATGGHASLIAPHTNSIDRVEPWLTLDGLRLIAERNLPNGSR